MIVSMSEPMLSPSPAVPSLACPSSEMRHGTDVAVEVEHVHPIATPDHIRTGVRVARGGEVRGEADGVVTRAAVFDIVPFAATQGVVTALSEDLIVAQRAVQKVGALTAMKDVAAVLTIHRVVATPAVDRHHRACGCSLQRV